MKEMNFAVVLLKAAPFLLAGITIASLVLIASVGVRVFQQKVDKTTVLLTIIGLIFLVTSLVSWRAFFNYWKSGAG